MRVIVVVLLNLLIGAAWSQWKSDAQPYKDKMRYGKAVSAYEKKSGNGIENKDLDYARTLFSIGEFRKAFYEYQKFHASAALQTPRDIYNFISASGIAAPELRDSLVKFYSAQQTENGILGYKDEILLSLDTATFLSACFNSPQFEDFSPALLGNSLLFVSSRTNPLNRSERYDYNSQPFYNVYVAELQNGCSVKDIDAFKATKPKEFNTDLHDGPVYVSTEKGLAFVTRNISKKTNVYHMGIFWSQFLDGKWSSFKPLSVNGTTYSVQHPYFHKETEELYFSSNMAGPTRGFDLYKMKFTNGEWSAAEVLSGPVNTPLDEVFPGFHNGKLYFSSNGFAGLGGLDVYSVRNDTVVREDAFNSVFDDYGLLWLNDSMGYLSSNRTGGFGKDDILQFTMLKDIQKFRPMLSEAEILKKTEDEILARIGLALGRKPVFITFIDSTTKLPLVNEFIFIEGSEIAWKYYPFQQTNQFGQILLPVDRSLTKLSITAKPSGYRHTNRVMILDTAKSRESSSLSVIPLQLGDNLTKIFDLGSIDYERNSNKLTIASKMELNKVVEILLNNPGLTIEIGNHTDSRGTAQNNLTASQNRAKAAFEFIVNNGVDSNQATYKGYGESKLLNRCVDNVVCSEQEHSENRRTEFLITSLPLRDSASRAIYAANLLTNQEAKKKAALANSKIVNAGNSLATSGKTNSASTSQKSSGNAAVSNSGSNSKGIENTIGKTSNNNANTSSTSSGSSDRAATAKTIAPVVKKANSMKTLDYKCGDADGDGILDYLDSDSDNDGLLDRLEGSGDFDNDGYPNYRDLDSDNDGLSDEFEGMADFDRDGKADFLDLDSDNDGIEDKTEGVADTDGDGRENYIDLDSDGDGITDRIEGLNDGDKDGTTNYLDLDSDNDGIPDKLEGAADADRDGISNYLDLDSDGDGFPDSVERGDMANGKPLDSDNDGKPNYLDLDSDNDGLTDKDEAPNCLTDNSSTTRKLISGTPLESSQSTNYSINPSRNNSSAIVSTSANQTAYSTDKVDFRVQIYTSSNKLGTGYFKNRGLASVFEYFHAGAYKYCVNTVFSTEEEAKSEAQRLKQLGFADAFVVSFKNGVRIR